MSPLTPGEKLYGGNWKMKDVNVPEPICHARQRASGWMARQVSDSLFWCANKFYEGARLDLAYRLWFPRRQLGKGPGARVAGNG